MSNQTQLSTFSFESKSIRTLAINNEPWFVAKDVCDAIGLTNSRMSLIALDEDEKGVSLIYTPSGQQEMNIVSESGMYTLILRCRDAVKKDLFHTVLENGLQRKSCRQSVKRVNMNQNYSR